jgi:hypothetical protein
MCECSIDAVAQMRCAECDDARRRSIGSHEQRDAPVTGTD